MFGPTNQNTHGSDMTIGVCFQNVQTDETFVLLPEDGDVVVDVDELQQNPMKFI